jgi:hypothetical protein
MHRAINLHCLHLISHLNNKIAIQSGNKIDWLKPARQQAKKTFMNMTDFYGSLETVVHTHIFLFAQHCSYFITGHNIFKK